jgi:hypothetical protein
MLATQDCPCCVCDELKILRHFIDKVGVFSNFFNEKTPGFLGFCIGGHCMKREIARECTSGSVKYCRCILNKSVL